MRRGSDSRYNGALAMGTAGGVLRPDAAAKSCDSSMAEAPFEAAAVRAEIAASTALRCELAHCKSAPNTTKNGREVTSLTAVESGLTIKKFCEVEQSVTKELRVGGEAIASRSERVGAGGTSVNHRHCEQVMQKHAHDIDEWQVHVGHGKR